MTNKFAQMMAARRAGEAATPQPAPMPQTPAAQIEKAVEQGKLPSTPPAPTKPSFGFAKQLVKPPVAQPKPEPASDDFSLDDLADSMVGDADSARETRSQFDDETPAQKPTRELPEDCDQGLRAFVELIDSVYAILDDPELLGNVIKSLMIELKSNPQYMQQVCDEDIRTWVRAMRNHMGLARLKKTEAKEKRAKGGAKGKSSKVDADMLDAFAELGVEL